MSSLLPAATDRGPEKPKKGPGSNIPVEGPRRDKGPGSNIPKKGPGSNIPKRSRAFIFDAGNVLLHWAPAEVLRAVLPRGAQVDHYVRGLFSSALWYELDRGQLDEEDAIGRFARALGASADEIRRLIRAGQDSLVPLSAGVGLLQELHRQGRDLVCLTNMSRENFARVRARYGFWECFRGIVVSGEVRMAKPDPAIFRHTLELYGLDAAQTVFIDDHRPNVEAARSLGIMAIEYDGSAACIERIRSL